MGKVGFCMRGSSTWKLGKLFPGSHSQTCLLSHGPPTRRIVNITGLHLSPQPIRKPVGKKGRDAFECAARDGRHPSCEQG